jgi:hypothetical protein
MGRPYKFGDANMESGTHYFLLNSGHPFTNWMVLGMLFMSLHLGSLF